MLRRRLFGALLFVVLLYLAVGLAFHIAWERADAACRAELATQGVFVEPRLGGPVALLFDVTNWPVYVMANVLHTGTPLATPCAWRNRTP